MGKHIQLTIADPCHEDWDKMTKSEQGKFCGSCQKQVIDFTGMTDTQLATFFKKKSTETVCGRFYDDQLDRSIPVPRKRIPWVRYFFQFSLPLFLTTLKAKAQKGEVAVKTIQTESCRKDLPIYGNVSPLIADMFVDQGILIKGVVVNEEGNPVPFASIEKGLVGTAADSTGAFSLVVASIKGLKLKISSVGYESCEIEPTPEQIINIQPIIVKLKSALMDEVIVSADMSRSLKGLVGGAVSIITCTYETQYPVLLEEPGFKIYANPARANSKIFINAGESEAGLYAIQLLNLSGQLIKQEQAMIDKGIGAIPFSVPAIPSGTYVVVLLNKTTGKKASEKLLIQ
jgi:hypothetical protein